MTRRHIVIIEKDAVFQRLVEEGFAEATGSILLTAKGMPDVSTRLFAGCLANSIPDCKVLAGKPLPNRAEDDL